MSVWKPDARAVLWCSTGSCGGPTEHWYYGVRHNGPAQTVMLVYTCETCKRERIWGEIERKSWTRRGAA